MLRKTHATFVWTLSLVLLTGCGSGTAALFGGDGDGGGSTGNAPTVISDILLGGVTANTKTSPVTFAFRATDAESNAVSVSVRYVDPTTGIEHPVTLSGNTQLTGLTTSSTGVTHTRMWDFASQLPNASALTSGVILRIRTPKNPNPFSSAPFSVGNDGPSIADLTAPAGPTAGMLHVDFELADSSSDLVSVSIEYDDLGDAAGWLPATLAGGAVNNIATTPAGVPVAVIWDAASDEPGRELSVRLRLTPSDGVTPGAEVLSAVLALDNNAESSVSNLVVGNGAASLKLSPIDVSFVLADLESDPVDVTLAYVPPGGGADVPLTLSGNTNLLQLAANPTGVAHVRQWDFANQLASGTALASGYRIRVTLSGSSSSALSASFDAGNDAPVVSNVAVPPGVVIGNAAVTLTLSDSSSDLTTVDVLYDDLGDGLGWLPATAVGGGLTNFAATPSGTPATFVWDALSDVGTRDLSAQLRFVPHDTWHNGLAVTSATFVLDNNGPTAVSNLSVGAGPASFKSSPLVFSFRLSDSESDLANVEVLFTTSGGAPLAAVLSGNTNLSGLASSPSGTVHARAWDFAAQLANGAGLTQGVTLTVRTVGGASSTSAGAFDVGNDAPVASNVAGPSSAVVGNASVTLSLADSSSDPVSVTVEYDNLDDAAGWQPATPVGLGLINVAATPAGVPVTFVWNALVDAGSEDFDALLRFTPSDGLALGASAFTGTFHVDNDSATVVSAVTPQLASGGGKTSPLDFAFTLTDAEADAADVQVLFAPPGGGAPQIAQLVGNTSLTGLVSSANGTAHTRSWDFASQLAGGPALAQGVTLIVRTLDLSSSASSSPFDVGNDAPAVSGLQGPSATVIGAASATAALSDSTGDLVSVTVEYDNLDDAAGWQPATPVGQALTNVLTSPGGVPISFAWNALADEGTQDFQAVLRFTPDDGFAVGASATTAVFQVDDNGSSIVSAVEPDTAVAANKTSPLAFMFTLTDTESDPVDVAVLYTPPGGGAAVAAQLSGNTSLSGLASSPAGVVHTRHWDFASQLGAGLSSEVALTVRTSDLSSTATSSAFDVGNDAPVVSNLQAPAGPVTGSVATTATLADSSSDVVSVTVEYDNLDDAAGWQLATPVGQALNNVASSAAGVAIVFVWDALADEASQDFDARLRFTPSDGFDGGVAVLTGTIAIDNNGTPVVSAVTPDTGPIASKSSPLAFTFELTDAESDAVDVEVLYTPPGGGAPVVAQLAGVINLTGLASSPAGIVHTRDWDFAGQLGTGFSSGVTLIVRTIDLTSSAVSIPFDVGNDAPVVANVVEPSGSTSGLAHLVFTLSDSSSDLVDITVEYDRLGDASGWLSATAVGQPLTNLATNPLGSPAHFFWNAPADEPSATFQVQLRFTATDGTDTAAPVVSDAFTIDNNSAPQLIVDGAAFFATPDDRRGIPLPFRLADAESDDVRVVFQWRTPLQSFPALPASPSALDALLADPLQRALYRIASERPIAWLGRAKPITSTTLRLTETGSQAAGLLAGAVTGRTLELLRGDARPSAVASTWSSNLLTSPVAVLPWDDGDSALVLDSASAGTWRLREIDLASGALVRTIATSSGGDPCALAPVDDGSERVLVADVVAGAWDVLRVELDTGAITTLKSASGATALGNVRGLASTGEDTAVLTVGNSLIEIDASQLPATERLLIGSFQAAWGLVLDPHRADRLFVAERDWVNPATANVEGRVVAVDLRSLARVTVVATGAPLRRPESVALERDGARLIAVCDASAVDSTRELRAVDIGGGEGGVAFEIVNTLPTSASQVATGPDGLRIVVLTAANDLAVGGGVQQVRTISSWDVATHVATLSSALVPVPTTPKPWRIVDDVDVTLASPSGVTDVFVWDSSDLIEGGQAILRGVPYDSEQGLESDTSVPRTVLAGLEVTGIVIGSVVSTNDVIGIATADLNGDGDLDLVTTNTGADRVTVFHQASPGAFPALPDETLAGIPILAPMTDPVSVTIVDVDSDGDLDLVSANRASNNFSVLRQTTPGNFATELLNLGLGVVAPEDVAAGDLNGDGRIDLVTANGGSDRLTIFIQLLAGLYLPLPSATIGNATTDKPTGVSVGDLDGDGDIDIASCNENSDNVTLFFQTSPGVFAAAPSLTLGGAGVTEAPNSIALADLNRDGRLDIATSNGGGNSLTVFLQTAPGVFAVAPSFSLSSSSGPVTPRDVEFADLNGDGWLDLLSVNSSNDVTAFLYRGASGAFESTPLVFGDGGELNDPRQLATGDFDGDGSLDIAVTDFGDDEIVIFFQRGGGAFESTPDVSLGSAVDTPGAAGLVTLDLDADGDFDLACANETGDSLSLYRQHGPAVFGLVPYATLGQGSELNGARALSAADFDGDGDVDLASANGSAGTLAVFLQGAGGSFTTAASQILGGGALGQPAWIAAADLDADGDVDLVNANESGHNLTLFLQTAPGTFASSPSATYGNAATTNSPVHVVAADLDGDGDVDLVCASRASNTLGVFLASAPGVLPATPSATLGSGATTSSPRTVVVGDFDADGDLDLASANASTNNVTIFLQSTPGTFPSSPSRTITHASISTPTTLATNDTDGDGDLDLIVGSSGSHVLALFEQTSPGLFAALPQTFGNAGTTDAPRALIALDLDGDDDIDLVSAQPTLDALAVFYGSH